MVEVDDRAHRAQRKIQDLDPDKGLNRPNLDDHVSEVTAGKPDLSVL